MAEYTLYFTSTASTRITVEAESLTDAEELAADMFPSVCAQCAGYGRPDGVGIDLSDVWELDEKAAAEDYPNG